MEQGETTLAILVLARERDKERYEKALEHLGATLFVSAEVGDLVERLADGPCAGLVLDIHGVMSASRPDRDRLLKLAEPFPVLRSKVDRATRHVLFLDDVECFFHNAQTVCPKRLRCVTRYPARFNVQVSREDDPAMTAPVPANILNISGSGCFILTQEDFSGSRFVYLRVLEFEDKKPIFCLIRWRRIWGEPGILPGIGVVFVDIEPAQLDQIERIGNQR